MALQWCPAEKAVGVRNTICVIGNQSPHILRRGGGIISTGLGGNCQGEGGAVFSGLVSVSRDLSVVDGVRTNQLQLGNRPPKIG
jgi:hypothetical protein